MFYYTLNQNAFVEAEQNRCADIQGLMTLMTESNTHIFQNSDFLYFASSAINPYAGSEEEFHARVDLPVEVSAGSSAVDHLYDIFGLTDYEVCPYTTVDELLSILEALYDYRVFSGLEREPDHFLPIDRSSCTPGTQEAIAPVAALLEAGAAAKAYADVMNGFYLMVTDYLTCGTSPCETIDPSDYDDSLFEIH